MISLGAKQQLLSAPSARQLYLDPDKKILAYELAGLIFVFSFHPATFFTDFHFWLPQPGNYQINLHCDQKKYGGFDLLDENVSYATDAHQYVWPCVPIGW